MSTDPVPTFSYHSPLDSPQSISNFTSKNSDSTYQSPLKSSQPGPSTWQSSGNNPTPQKTQRKKVRTSEENEIMNATAARFVSRLAEDHVAVLNPDLDSPFIDSVDIVKRLLPYHIYLNPKEDLKPLVFDRKGKSKADELRKENEETKFALECFKRRRNLQNRFRNARTKSGQTPFKEETVLLDQVLDSEKSELAKLNSELRAARAELERLERAKRAASSTPRHSYYPTAVPASVPTGPTAYYRAYPYAYAQAYGTALATAPSISTFAVTPTTSSTSVSAQTPPASATTTSALVPASTISSVPANPTPSAVPYQAGAAIPVQLPLSSLPALHQLGIIPAAASATPATGQSAPAAVLRGSSGSMLNLEINVSQLQPAQMSGLALILNSLMSRTAAPSGAQVYATPLPSAATTTTSNRTINRDGG